MQSKIVNKSLYLSHRQIEALPVPSAEHPSTSIEYSDTTERGLKIAVYKSGLRSFRHRYTVRGKKQSVTLGEFPALSLEQARKRVQSNKLLIVDSVSPKDERVKRIEGLTFAEFVTDDYATFAKNERRSWRDIENRINLRLIPAFGDLPLPQLTKPMVAKFHQELRKDVSPTTANRYLALISAVYNKAMELGHVTENPTHDIVKFKESGARTRVLSNDELKRFMSALNEVIDTAPAKAIYLLITLGLRKMEVLSLRWENIDFDQQQAYLPTTKAGKPRYVTLNSLALELLEKMHKVRVNNNPWLFPSRSKSGHLQEVRKTFDRVTLMAKIKGLRTHDLRRSFASNLVNAGVSVYEVRDLLGHADVRTTQIYAHLASTTLQQASEVSATILKQALAT